MNGGTITLKDDRLIFRFDYDPHKVGAMREVPGRAWNPESKVWTAPVTSIRAARKFADTYHLDLSVEVVMLDDCEPDTRPRVDVIGSKFTLRFDYDRDLNAQVRDLPGAKWSRASRSWTADLDASVEVAQFALATNAVIETTAGYFLADAVDALTRIEASAASDADLTIEGLGGELLPFQRAGVSYVLKADGGVMIGDQMGLGKTVQALATLAVFDARPAVVVCPASLKLNWQREAQTWLPGWSTHVITGTRAGQHRNPPADLTILNYDILDTWADVLPKPAAAILDESHYVKNGTTIRTRAAIRLSDRMDANAVRLCLTGTPIVNAPGEIVTQLRFLHRIDDFGGVAEFKRRYQSGRNLPELNRRLRASCLVRRRKDDVLTDLPPKRWSQILVDGDSAEMREYRKAEKDIVSFLADRARKVAMESGATTEAAQQAAWEAILRAEAAEHLVAISALKRLAARAKIGAVRQWVQDFTDTGSKLVVFAHHRELVDLIATEFTNDCSITGTTTLDNRQQAVDRFQNDPDTQVIACSLKAAGVGLTLTAASDVLFIEQGWTPADMDQAADRCHRIGQTDSVTAWTMITSDTIDEDIANLIAAKRVIVDAVTDGTSDDEDESKSILGDLLVKLTERGLHAG